MRKKMLLVVCSVILCISIIGCGVSKQAGTLTGECTADREEYQSVRLLC